MSTTLLRLLDDELTISFCPSISQVCYEGRRASLEAAGVAPPRNWWPERFDRHWWCQDRFQFRLSRIRPEGVKGPRAAFYEVDHWRLVVQEVDPGDRGFFKRDLAIKRAALEREAYSLTPEGREAASAAHRKLRTAKDDQAFQRWLTDSCPPKVRGRTKSPSQPGEQGLGTPL